VIVIDRALYEQIMRVLRNVNGQEALDAQGALMLAAIEAKTRGAQFNNEVPALCRAQAG
jgi:hypothetical protein